MTWNLNHRTHEKKIKPEIIRALVGLKVDIFVFTEFVDGPTRAEFFGNLADEGYTTLCSKLFAKKHNQILLGAKSAVVPGAIMAPTNVTEALPSNALHIEVPALGIEVLGIRVPDYSKNLSAKNSTWRWILGSAQGLAKRPSIILGDFNTDVSYSEARCGPRIKELVNTGFTQASPPEGEASYWTPQGKPCRIDHAFFSEHFQVHKANYVTEVGGLSLVGPGGLSDHSALLVEFEFRLT